MHDILFQDGFDIMQMAMCFNAGIIFAEYVDLWPDDAVLFEPLSCVVGSLARAPSRMKSRRLRLPHLRGAAGLAFEADVVLMMNEKATAVSKLHSAFDPIRAPLPISIGPSTLAPAPTTTSLARVG